ncbi:MAG: TonB-dependent receptor [Candidatus Cloacimonetes bacterium]|nr:TonB-dependent receptor [Candidatus Cloacimonadota bacterium]
MSKLGVYKIMEVNRRLLYMICLVIFLIASSISAAGGKVSGLVIDAGSKDPLPGANAFLEGTTYGAATDLDGQFTISNVPAGNYNLMVSFLGYKKYSTEIVVQDNRKLFLEIELEFDAVDFEDVVVTSQLEGQAKAINQQISSNTIVNVVSSDRIQELPDANAAESIGRLPGVAIQRDAGEGTKVVVRGLSPKFNSITVNGERIPGTDPNERSVDLSMISPDVLAGIELFKALRPDMDGDAIGGTINFVLSRAKKGFNTNTRAEVGYNDHEKSYGNYKVSTTLSNRFFNNKLGALATGSAQRADRSSDLLDATYAYKGAAADQSIILDVDDLSLVDRLEDRDRYSASLALDYQMENSDFRGNIFWGNTKRNETTRSNKYRIGEWYHDYSLDKKTIETTMFTSQLSGDHTLFEYMTLDWRVSFSQSDYNVPDQHFQTFRELAPFEQDIVIDQGLIPVQEGAKNDLASTIFRNDNFYNEAVTDKNLTAQFNFTIPYFLGDNASGFLKFGGKIRDKDRKRDRDRYTAQAGNLEEWANMLEAQGMGPYERDAQGRVTFSNFIDPDYDPNPYLNGDFDFGPGLDPDAINKFLYDKDYLLSLFLPIENRFMYLKDLGTDKEDYGAAETIYAAYAMTELKLNLFVEWMFLVGGRYEQTVTGYESFTGNPRIDEETGALVGSLSEISGGRDYGNFLPMFHLRSKITDWMDIRLAATRSLSRPDYFNLVPWQKISYTNLTISQGNPNLLPTEAWNYDVYTSFYSNLGLFTIGAFYKSVNNIDYIVKRRISSNESEEYAGFTITEPRNSPESTVQGVEFEVQTNLKFLPFPFNGIVLYANYSIIESKTQYPFFSVTQEFLTQPPWVKITAIDTFRTGQMPGQADQIANITLGYETGGFSGRVSVIYQGRALKRVGPRSELDSFEDDFFRLDAAIQQRVMEGLSVFLNLNNITNYNEASSLGLFNSLETRSEYYGLSANLGVRYQW